MGWKTTIIPNLRKLDLSLLGARDPEREVFLELTEMFTSLVSLRLRCLKLASPTWLALSAHPRVTELILCGMVIKAAEAPLFWALCKRLETLSFDRVTFDNGTIPAGTMFDRLRDLNVTNIENMALSAQLDLALRCQNLKRLSWNDYDSADQSEHPALDTDRIQKGYWHRLEKLSIHHHFQDTQVAPILDGVGDGGLVHLELHDCRLGEQGSNALCRHFATLVSLSLAAAPLLGIYYSLAQDWRLYMSRLSAEEMLRAEDHGFANGSES